MIIDLRAVTAEAESRVSELLDREWWGGSDADDPIIGLDSPLQVNVRVFKAGNKFVLSGSLSGGLQVRCDRCLETYHKDLETSFQVFLVERSAGGDEADLELLDGDMEVDFIRGEEIALDEVIREQIYLSLPIQCVCSEGCLGLCSSCGANLNKGTCGCRGHHGHPAFSGLKNLKIKSERG